MVSQEKNITIQIMESPPAACGVAGGRAEDVSSNSLGQTFALKEMQSVCF